MAKITNIHRNGYKYTLKDLGVHTVPTKEGETFTGAVTGRLVQIERHVPLVTFKESEAVYGQIDYPYIVFIGDVPTGFSFEQWNQPSKRQATQLRKYREKRFLYKKKGKERKVYRMTKKINEIENRLRKGKPRIYTLPGETYPLPTSQIKPDWRLRELIPYLFKSAYRGIKKFRDYVKGDREYFRKSKENLWNSKEKIIDALEAELAPKQYTAPTQEAAQQQPTPPIPAEA